MLTDLMYICLIVLFILDIYMLRIIDKHEQAIAELLMKTGLGEMEDGKVH